MEVGEKGGHPYFADQSQSHRSLAIEEGVDDEVLSVSVSILLRELLTVVHLNYVSQSDERVPQSLHPPFPQDSTALRVVPGRREHEDTYPTVIAEFRMRTCWFRSIWTHRLVSIHKLPFLTNLKLLLKYRISELYRRNENILNIMVVSFFLLF